MRGLTCAKAGSGQAATNTNVNTTGTKLHAATEEIVMAFGPDLLVGVIDTRLLGAVGARLPAA